VADRTKHERRLEGRRALISGATGGQGEAVARRFVAEGARVALTDKSGERLGHLISDLIDEGHDAVAFPCDVRDEAEVEAVVKAAADTLGGLDVLYNNAGVYWPDRDAPVDRLERGVWDEILAINTTSVFLFSKHALKHLLAAGDGVILNVASVAAYAGDAQCHAYAASKGALIALTMSIAQCYGNAGLRANVICPGFIATPMVDWLLADASLTEKVTGATALARVGTPQEVASVAAFLASADAPFVTAGVIPVHGGLVK